MLQRIPNATQVKMGTGTTRQTHSSLTRVTVVEKAHLSTQTLKVTYGFLLQNGFLNQCAFELYASMGGITLMMRVGLGYPQRQTATIGENQRLQWQ